MWKCVFLLVVAAVVVALPAAASTTAPAASQPVKASAGPVEPSAQNGCTAQNDNCPDGCPTISCSGTTSCLVGSNYVECDGNRTYCQMGCNVCYADAICGPRPGNSIHCQGSYYCNSADGCWVTCDFYTTYCPDAPPSCPYPN